MLYRLQDLSAFIHHHKDDSAYLLSQQAESAHPLYREAAQAYPLLLTLRFLYLGAIYYHSDIRALRPSHNLSVPFQLKGLRTALTDDFGSRERVPSHSKLDYSPEGIASLSDQLGVPATF